MRRAVWVVMCAVLMTGVATRGALVDYAGAAAFIPADDSNYTPAARNVGRRGVGDIAYIVIHTIQGSAGSAINWFRNPASNVSAHYVVSRAGEVTQMLQEKDIGWHAGNWTYNVRSIGIEHEGYVEDPRRWYTPTMYEASAALVRDIAMRNRIPLDREHILGHVEVPGATHTDPGSGWNWDHYMALLQVPEPASMWLMALGAAVMARHRGGRVSAPMRL